MKKLFSAAASLVMAATMVGAVAPVGASAADAKKGLSFLAYKDAELPSGVKADGATITVSADAIAAGDVVIPVGMYISEDTPDLSGISADATVKSDSADVKKVKFKAYTPGADTYFSAEKEFTAADGSTFSTDTVAGFAGSYDKREGYTAHGKYTVASAESQTKAGTDNAFVGVAWTNGGSKYKWHGAKSDTYPLVVFDVTLPKGIAEGEYVIDYCNYKTEYGGNQSCLLEAGSQYSSATNNLDLNTLTIKVGDASSSDSSTTTTTTQTTATTAATGSTTTTVATSKPDNKLPDDQLAGNSQIVADSDIVFDFTNPDDENGYWRIDPEYGDITVDIALDTHGTKITAVSAFLDVEGGFNGGKFSQKSPTLNNAAITANKGELAFSLTCEGSDGHGTASDSSKSTVASVYLDPTGIPDGLYKITLDPTKKLSVCDDANPANNLDISVIPGYIAIGDVAATTTATTATTASTTKGTTTASTTKAADKTTTASTTKGDDKTTTTTTKAPATTGDVHYGDTNCDGSVKINDVVLLNKWLNDNKSYDISDQGKLNADCYNPKKGEELTADDSDAIIKSIVHLVELPVQK